MLPSLLRLHSESIWISSCLVAVPATLRAYWDELSVKEDCKRLVQKYRKIIGFRNFYLRTFTPSWQIVI